MASLFSPAVIRATILFRLCAGGSAVAMSLSATGDISGSAPMTVIPLCQLPGSDSRGLVNHDGVPLIEAELRGDREVLTARLVQLKP